MASISRFQSFSISTIAGVIAGSGAHEKASRVLAGLVSLLNFGRLGIA